MRGKIILATLAVALMVFALPQSASAVKPGNGCGPGFDLGAITVEEALLLSNVQAGSPETVTQTERDQRQRQLAEQSAYAELTSYVGTLREQATVRIPDDVLNPRY